MEYFLLQRESNNEHPIIINLEGEEMTVGRQTISSLSNIKVSRKHALFMKASNGRWFIKDLGSLNGLFINGKKVGKRLEELKIGDIIGFGVPGIESADGFVCIFCTKSQTVNVKQERINLPSDDESAVQPVSTVTSNSVQSCSVRSQRENKAVLGEQLANKAINDRNEPTPIVTVKSEPCGNHIADVQCIIPMPSSSIKIEPNKCINVNISSNETGNVFKISDVRSVATSTAQFNNPAQKNSFQKGFDLSSSIQNQSGFSVKANSSANIAAFSTSQINNPDKNSSNQKVLVSSSNIQSGLSNQSSNSFKVNAISSVSTHMLQFNNPAQNTSMQKGLNLNSNVQSELNGSASSNQSMLRINNAAQNSCIQKVLNSSSNVQSGYTVNTSTSRTSKFFKATSVTTSTSQINIPSKSCIQKGVDANFNIQNESCIQKGINSNSKIQNQSGNANVSCNQNGNLFKANNTASTAFTSQFKVPSKNENTSTMNETSSYMCSSSDLSKALQNQLNVRAKDIHPNKVFDEITIDDDFGYSQKEIVITISDDDDLYLDFKSSQPNNVDVKMEYTSEDDSAIQVIENDGLKVDNKFPFNLMQIKKEFIMNDMDIDNENAKGENCASTSVPPSKINEDQQESCVTLADNFNFKSPNNTSDVHNYFPILSQAFEEESGSESDVEPLPKALQVKDKNSCTKLTKKKVSSAPNQPATKSNKTPKTSKPKNSPTISKPLKSFSESEPSSDVNAKSKKMTPTSTKLKKSHTISRPPLKSSSESEDSSDIDAKSKKTPISTKHKKSHTISRPPLKSSSESEDSSDIDVKSKKTTTTSTKPKKSHTICNPLVQSSESEDSSNDKIGAGGNYKKLLKTVSRKRTLLTDPKPMPFRTRVRKPKGKRLSKNNIVTHEMDITSSASATTFKVRCKSVNMPSEQTGNSVGNKKPTSVKRRPENYRSRNQLLLEDMSKPKPPSPKKRSNSKESSTGNNKLTLNGFKVPKKPSSETCRVSPLSLSESNSLTANSYAKKKKVTFSSEVPQSKNRVESNPTHKFTMGSPPAQTSPPKQKQLCDKINYDHMLSDVIDWNTVWLNEQTKMNFPPPAVSIEAAQLPLSFNSINQYVSSFYPMMLLELWETVFQQWKNICTDDKRTGRKFYFMVKSCESKHGSMLINCESIVNYKLSFYPQEGSLAILDLRDVTKRNVNCVFGFISRSNISKLKMGNVDLKNLNSEWRKLPQPWLDEAKMWSFSVIVKKLMNTLSYDCLMKANSLCYIKNKLRMADALRCLLDSQMTVDIIKPTFDTFNIKPSRASAILDGNYNEMQSQIIAAVSNDIRSSFKKPKIMLIQGPPGTGKTHTIIGILQQLMCRKSRRQKVLVTAPSNAAIDEIGRRLAEYNILESSKARPYYIQFIRVGQPKQIHPTVQPFSLDELAIESYKKHLQDDDLFEEKQLKSLKDEIDKLKKDIKHKKVLGIIDDEVTAKEKLLNKLVERYKTLNRHYHENLKRAWDPKTQRTFKLNILRDTDVVLSTLSSCSQNIVMSIFGPSSNIYFTCCIVDEATQCTEPEVLQPLMFGIHKLILVGDHQQLPATVHSKLAATYNYERSMYERFHMYFTKFFQTSPVLMLTEQFRMHSRICYFPSKQFYNGKLVTAPRTDISYKLYPIRPYTVFDIMKGQETDARSSKANINEALVIVEICQQLLKCIPPKSTIGIITPYSGQRELYANAFAQNPQYSRIEINTVDGFQGREKDIIIVSCVRANSASGGIGFLACRKRLNVAITRARQCLIICAHLTSLKQDPEWAALITDAQQRGVCIPICSSEEVQVMINQIIKV